MNLADNAFAVLGIGPDATRDEIALAAEDAIIDGLRDEALIRRAQQQLTVSRPRLDAEAAWPLGIETAKVKSALLELQRTCDALPDAWRELIGLSKANLAAHLCDTHARAKKPLRGNAIGQTAVNALFEATTRISASILMTEVNAARSRSGFPPITDDMAKEALKAVRELHAEAIVSLVVADERPGLAMTDVVKRFLGSEGSADFLEAVVEKWDRWSISALADLERRIKLHLADTEANADANPALMALREEVAKWDELNQPRQEVFFNKGLDEPKALEIYQMMRALALKLANEKGRFKDSKAITSILKDHFQELPSVIKQMHEDSEALDGLIVDAAANEVIGPFVTQIKAIIDDPEKLGLGVKQIGACSVRASNKVSELLATTFQEATARSKGTAFAGRPFECMRILSVVLFNDKDEIAAALWAAELTISHPDYQNSASENDRRILDEGISRIRTALAISWISSARARNDNKSAAAAADEALELVHGEQDRTLLLAAKAIADRAAGQQDVWRGIKWVVGLGIAAFVAIIIYDDSRTPTYYSNSASSSYSSSASSQSLSPSIVPPSNSTLVDQSQATALQMALSGRPTGKTGQDLSEAEYKWCIFEGERLNQMQSILSADNTEAHVKIFNAFVDAYNRLCVDRMYVVSWESATSQERDSKASELLDDALTRMEYGFSASDAPWPGQALDLRVEIDAMQVQWALQKKGLYKGAIDGRFGPASRQALNTWAGSIGAATTADILDPSIVGKLF